MVGFSSSGFDCKHYTSRRLWALAYYYSPNTLMNEVWALLFVWNLEEQFAFIMCYTINQPQMAACMCVCCGWPPWIKENYCADWVTCLPHVPANQSRTPQCPRPPPGGWQAGRQAARAQLQPIISA